MVVANDLATRSALYKSWGQKDANDNVLNKAQELAKQNKDKDVIVYGNKALVVTKEALNELNKTFGTDIKQQDGVYVASGKAKQYINKMTNFVLNDLNVGKSDKDKDGMLTVGESLSARIIVGGNSLISADGIFNQDTLKQLEQDDSLLMDINDFISENIKIDKDKDGKVTVKEIKDFYEPKDKVASAQTNNSQESKGSSASNLDKLIKALKKRLAKINQQIQSLQKSDQKQNVQMVSSLNSEKASILAQINELTQRKLESTRP